MKLAAHESHELKELALSCVNTITNMALFMNEAKDPELKAMIKRQFETHVLDYNIKVDYLSKPTGTTAKLPVPQLPAQMPQYTTANVATQPITPRTNITEFNDREIATAYLLTLKRAGREYAWSAMEASNPGIREFLEDAFRMASHHAYEVWEWMVKKGYYPLEESPADHIAKFGNMFKNVKQPAMTH